MASRGQPVANVYTLALLAYAAFAVTDVCLKASAGRLPIFESAFIVNVFAAAVLLLTRHSNERWRDFFRTGDHALAVHGRAVCGVVSSVGAIYAFTTIPFAQVYAIVFLAPFFVAIMSVLFLKERIPLFRWLGVSASFAGVLLVIKPGFQPLGIGHLAAAVVGLATGGAVIIMRGMNGKVRKTSILGMLLVYLIVLNAVAMIVRGVVAPTGRELLLLGLAGVSYGLGQWAFVAAARAGTASQIVPMHYSQLLWGVGFGMLFFNEHLDGPGMLGIGVIIASGLFTILRAAPFAASGKVYGSRGSTP